MKILVSGEKGFLLSSCINELDGEIIPYEFGQNYYDIDMVIHFASPNDKYEFEDKGSMAFSMIDYSLYVIKQAIYNSAKIVFASSKAADKPDTEYGIYKRCIEQYIQGRTDNHLIYRIPRVYGSNRKKGLMKQLRLNDIDPEDLNKTISYLDIEDFKKWFIGNIDKTGIVRYTNGYRKNTIREIGKIYI